MAKQRQGGALMAIACFCGKRGGTEEFGRLATTILEIVWRAFFIFRYAYQYWSDIRDRSHC